MIQAIVRSIVVGLVPVVLGGCGAYDSVKDSIDGDEDSHEALSDEPTPIPTGAPPNPVPTAAPAEPEAPAEPTPPPSNVPSSESIPDDLSGVEFLHADVSDWKVVSTLDVSFGPGVIHLNYDKATVWPAVNGVNANPWVFVFRDGHWYAATWEWLGFGQTTKAISSVAGDHIKRSPLGDFVPRSGEVYGFMVSGLARGSERNVEKRTNVVMVRWP